MRRLFLLNIALVLISFFPLLYTQIKTPPDRVFTGINRWSDDYYAYLEGIQIGKRGAWLVSSSFTTIPHPPTLVHEEYLFLGHLAGIFNVSSGFIYHFARFVLALVFLYTSFVFIKTFVPQRLAFLTFLLSFTIGSFPLFSDLGKIITGLLPLNSSSYYLNWFVELDIISRTTLPPHYQMASICFLLVILYFLKIQTKPSFSNYTKVFLSGFFLTFFQPVSMFILLVILAVYLFIKSLLLLATQKSFSEKKTLLLFLVKPLATILLSAVPVLLYYRYIFSLPYWNYQLLFTPAEFNFVLSDLFLSFGPIFFLGLAGIVIILFFPKRGFSFSHFLLLISWLMGQFLVFFWVYRLLNFEQIRALFPPFYLPLAILAAYSLDFLALLFRQIIKLNFSFLLYGFYSLLFLLTLPSALSSLKAQMYQYTDYKTFSSFTFPTKKQMAVFYFLENNTSYKKRVLTLYEGTFLIPAMAGNYVSLGLNYNADPNFANRENLRNLFFQGTLTVEKANQFLRFEKISYIYWGYQEKSMGGIC